MKRAPKPIPPWARISLVAALVAAGVATALRPALAYCRTSSCTGATGTRCVPAADGDCGVVIAWSSPCVGFSVQADASAEVSLEAARSVFEAAFAAWESADCGGGHPRIRIEGTGDVACAKQEYNQNAGNANAILFRDDAWPHDAAATTIALTTVTYNLETGEIYDADIEVNTATMGFTIGGAGAGFELESVATHEAGHFLGLAHSHAPGATMTTGYGTQQFELSPDDVDGICAVYSPGAAIPAACDAEPRHGFSSLCGDDQPHAGTPPPPDGCAIAEGARREREWPPLALLGVLAAIRRRARRPRG